jgi:putative membrane protein
MKVFLRHILINLLVIYLVDIAYPGFSINHNTKTLLSAAVIWLLLNKIVKPVIKLLLLPINLITLNLFSWVISIITLFLLQMIVGGIQIISYDFPGYAYQGFAIPPAYINVFFSYLITSTALNTFHSAILWLIRKDSE